jgi:hypothetical protein
LGASYYKRQAACNGYILHDSQIEQAPTLQPVASLHKVQRYSSFLTGMLYKDGSIATIVSIMDRNFTIPQCSFTLDCIITINFKGYVICLSPAASTLSLFFGGASLYSVPYECTHDTSIALLGTSDFALVAVPKKSFCLINWKLGKVVMSGTFFPSLVVPVTDSVYVVNDTWTAAAVVPTSAFNTILEARPSST